MKKLPINNLSRRQFVVGATSALAASSALAVSALPFSPNVFAAPLADPGVQVLSGNQFDLRIGYQKVNYTGRQAIATTVNGTLPAPILRWKEGDRVRLRVTNNLAEDSSIHWHGIVLPSTMDGSPGFDFAGIKPGESFDYEFDIKQSGTYWYHSHSGFQEQTGLTGAIIIDPKGADPIEYDRDMVVLLSDWTDKAPKQVYANLKKMSHYYNYNERTLGDTWRDIKTKGIARTWNERSMWNQMRMSDSDISDVNGYAYTYLMNGVTPAQGWLGLCKPNEKVRLRFINGAAMTIFDIRIPGLEMTVVAADGQAIQPVSVDEFRIGNAETYDVIVTPEANRAYTLFAQTIDRTGYARGILTSDPSLRVEVPAMDPAPILNHQDMGMGPMDHSAHGASHDIQATPEVKHSVHDMRSMDHSGHDTGNMGAMDHSAHDMSTTDHSAHTAQSTSSSASPGTANTSQAAAPAEMDHSAHHTGHAAHDTTPTAGMDHSVHEIGAMDHSDHQMDSANTESAKSTPTTNLAKAGFGSNFDRGSRVQHSPSEFGPHVDSHSVAPASGLADPGIGLRDHQKVHNRKVLTYADLRGLHPTRDKREPTREIEWHLTGNMHRYTWSINGLNFMQAAPLVLKFGERVRIILINDTMMTHPIHLHGMWSELETGDPDFIPRKHTILVQPGSKISYLVTADAKGRWAYHCHMLYHMFGMMRTVQVL